MASKSKKTTFDLDSEKTYAELFSEEQSKKERPLRRKEVLDQWSNALEMKKQHDKTVALYEKRLQDIKDGKSKLPPGTYLVTPKELHLKDFVQMQKK